VAAESAQPDRAGSENREAARVVFGQLPDQGVLQSLQAFGRIGREHDVAQPQERLYVSWCDVQDAAPAALRSDGVVERFDVEARIPPVQLPPGPVLHHGHTLGHGRGLHLRVAGLPV
jgi:hypothetical protein